VNLHERAPSPFAVQIAHRSPIAVREILLEVLQQSLIGELARGRHTLSAELSFLLEFARELRVQFFV
jgi:hypothetical protein